MPNTEVKLSSAENTCLETDREDRKVLAFSLYGRKVCRFSPMPALAGRKRKMPSEPRQGIKKTDIRQLPVSSTKYSPIAQSVEHMTVNHGVVGSSPTGGAIPRQCI